MEFKRNLVVVKFNDREKTAVSVFGSTDKQACIKKAAEYRGIFKEDEQFIRFGVYLAWVYDLSVDIERNGGDSVYECLLTQGHLG